MKDSELRGQVLEVFYKARHKIDWLELSALATHIVGVGIPVIGNICEQLAEHGLVQWKPLRDGTGPVGGMGRITAQGVDVVEGTAKPPISITLHDHHISISQSSHVQIGDRNVQTTSFDIEKLISAIDSATACDGEKGAAKSLIQRISENKLLLTVLGAFLTHGSAAR